MIVNIWLDIGAGGLSIYRGQNKFIEGVGWWKSRGGEDWLGSYFVAVVCCLLVVGTTLPSWHSIGIVTITGWGQTWSD